MKTYKAYKNRFHSWQLNPTNYKYPGEKHRCDCCGEEHEGNFCPLCGQKATHGPVTWESVWTGWLEIWGMHSRSLPYTAWQLLTRPGSVMLVISGFIVFLLGHWVNPQKYTHEITTIASGDSLYYIKYAFAWLKTHEEWFTLFTFSFLILPTWIVFRHAPRLLRHTLPQGFFIQTFIAIQVMILSLILILLELNPTTKSIASSTNIYLILIYLLIDYKQLFGYSWWGTIWRGISMLIMIIFAIFIIGGIISAIATKQNKTIETFGVIQATLSAAWLLYLLIYIVNVINTRAWRTKSKWAIFRDPIIALAIVIAISALGFIILR